jgi:BlaI family transcriptional regulator, penicillinase repressor
MTNGNHSLPKPTESELELLRILWDKEPATVRDIFDALNVERPSGYTTVLKLLQIMTAKGLVVRDEANRAHVYRAAISQDAMQSKILKDLSVRLFSGSAAQLALHALAMEQASEPELEEIRALLATRTPSHGRNGRTAPITRNTAAQSTSNGKVEL